MVWGKNRGFHEMEPSLVDFSRENQKLIIMLQDIINQTADGLLSDLKGKFGLDEAKAKETLSVSKDSLISTLGKEVGSGNLDGILNMLNAGSGVKNPICSKT
jgi:hypothetical protein